MSDVKQPMPRPHYDNPPVIEVILGVQFEPLAACSNGHLGAFWKSLGEDWTSSKDAPSLEPQFERFADAAKWRRVDSVRFSLSQDPSSRLQIKNKRTDRM